jgi:hypothetical protein
MMNIKQLPTRIEIGFWNLTIHLLSQSAWVRILVTWSYRNIGIRWDAFSRAFDAQRALFWAGVGLLLGFLGGFLAALPLY